MLAMGTFRKMFFTQSDGYLQKDVFRYFLIKVISLSTPVTLYQMDMDRYRRIVNEQAHFLTHLLGRGLFYIALGSVAVCQESVAPAPQPTVFVTCSNVKD